MQAKVIAGWNAAPGAPAGWDPARHGECGTLPIRVFPARAVTDRMIAPQYVESAWEPSADDLAHLNTGGQIVLRIFGWQPPVALYVEPRPVLPGEEPEPEHEPCAACPLEVRGLYAAAHNLLVSYDAAVAHMENPARALRKTEELRRAVAALRPLVDAHFADPVHAGTRRPARTLPERLIADAADRAEHADSRGGKSVSLPELLTDPAFRAFAAARADELRRPVMTRLRLAWTAGACGHPLPFNPASRSLVLAWKAGKRHSRGAEGRTPGSSLLPHPRKRPAT